MATVKQVVGTKSASILTMSTLASLTYIASTGQSTTANQPVDVVVEVVPVCGTVGGNKQLVVFIQESLDGTNYRTGPTSGSTTTDEPDLRFLGTVPMNSVGTHRGTFSIAQALGYVPPSYKIVVKNDSSNALTSGEVYVAEISNTVA